jgi:hypothetical protein
MQAAFPEILCARRRMDVGIDDARQDGPTTQIRGAGVRADQGADRLVGPHGNDRVAPQRHRLGDGAARVLRMDPTVQGRNVGRNFRDGRVRRLEEEHRGQQ